MSQDACFVDFEPIGRRATCQPGTDLLTIARNVGIGIASVCGGAGTCGRCRVRIISGNVSPLSDTEKRTLHGRADEGLRLACQTLVYGDTKVYVPATSLTARQRTQIEGESVAFELDPVTKVVDISLSAPPLTDLRSDAVRVREHVREQCDITHYDIDVLRHMSDSLRQSNWQSKAVIHDGEAIGLLGPDDPVLGLAVDLGTTKVAGYLVDLQTGAILAAEGIMNPQISFGEDVMARIAYVLANPENATTMSETIVSGLRQLAQTLCERSGNRCANICDAVVVGNTAMHHLFLRLPVRQLGNAPYLAATTDPLDVKARDIGLPFAPGCYVHLLPNIAGFVGADHVAMILATGLYQADETTVAVDIGTNTEIALYHEGRLLTCSTASGPAFEGAHITHGMRAAQGAIERVSIIDGEVTYQTIGNVAPVGICGSGILDAVAQLYGAGILNMKGAMLDGHPRVREREGGLEFVLAPAKDTGNHHDIVVTRQDVGEIQLAKAAMRAGVNVLLQEAGLQPEDIQKFIVAGAFGTYIDLQSAMDIGMFPRLPIERFRQVGNAAGAGARMALLSREARNRAKEIASAAEYIELTNDARFVEQFTMAMFLAPEMI